MNCGVLSNNTQLSGFFRAGYRLSEYQWFCDNPCFFDHLTSAGIPYKPLDEFLIVDEWNEINAWSCGVAAEFTKAARGGGFFREADVPSCLYLFFAYILVSALKNFCFASKIMATPGLKQCVVFQGASRAAFPACSGNQFLNYFLRYFCSERNIELRDVVIAPVDAPKTFPPHARPLRMVNFVKKILCALTQGKNIVPRGAICVYGSLHHLKSVVLELINLKQKLFVFNHEFNFDQSAFCRNHGIAYVVRSRESCGESPTDDEVESCYTELCVAVKNAGRKGLFRFRGHDLTRFILDEIISTTRPFLRKVLRDISWQQAVDREFAPGALVTDEDYALRGASVAAYMKACGRPVFCISHANMAVDFSVRPEQKVFGQGITLVQSEFEKEMWEARGWDPQKLKVTGTPRYDRLFRIRRERRSGKRLRLLFCANSYPDQVQTPDTAGFLGVHVYSFKQIVLPAAMMLFEAVRGLPIDLVIKPHNAYAADRWRTLIKEANLNGRVVLVSRPGSIWKQFASADVMALSYWSTTIIEAALYEMPVLFLNPLNLKSRAISEYCKQGFMTNVTSQGELCLELEKFRSRKDRHEALAQRSSHSEYYLGCRNGKASVRVAGEILHSLFPKQGDSCEATLVSHL